MTEIKKTILGLYGVVLRRITMSNLFIKIIEFYQILLSPLLGANCRFHPTCSEYAKEAIKKPGSVKGLWLSLKRISKCHPLGPYGLDPVPPRK